MRSSPTWTQVDEAWPALQKSGFLALEGIGVVLHYLRGCAALAAAETAPTEPRAGAISKRALLREADRAARRLRRVSLPTGAPLSLAIAAGVHAQRGQKELRTRALESAIAGFDAVDMALHRESARLVLGLVSGPAVEVERARAWMCEEAVQNPLALARATVPGPFPGMATQEPSPSLA